jgi:hypothetical protein
MIESWKYVTTKVWDSHLRAGEGQS